MNREERQGLITVSHLITKEDFMDFKSAACRLALKPNEVTFVRAVGFFMVLCGLMMRVFAGGTAYRNTVYVMLVLLGVVIAFFYDAVFPVFVRWQAGNYFEGHRERMIAQTVLFFEEEIKITTDRYTAHIPYEMLYGVYEDQKVFLLYTGLDEIWSVPKRALGQEECKQLQQILSEKLSEKYKQEGVR